MKAGSACIPKWRWNTEARWSASRANSDKRRDLLQEIHVALWRSLARFDGRCSMRTWVYRVAHNIATSHVIRPKTHAPTFVAFEALESIAVIAALGVVLFLGVAWLNSRTARKLQREVDELG